MIKVYMECECGNTASIETSRASGEHAILFYNQVVYICTECGKEMARKVTKVETTETETVIAEGN